MCESRATIANMVSFALSEGNQLLAFIFVLAILGIVHEIVYVRKVGRKTCWKTTGLIATTVVYVVVCFALLCGSDVVLEQHHDRLSGFLPATVEASFWGDALATVACFAFSFFLNNSSMYDAYWSVVPPIIVLYWWVKSGDFDCSNFLSSVAFSASKYNPRRWLAGIVYGAWGIRLTYNWARGWPGMHHVDWRYVPGHSSPQLFDSKKYELCVCTSAHNCPFIGINCTFHRSPFMFWLVSLLAFHVFPTVEVFVVCYWGEGHCDHWTKRTHQTMRVVT